MTAAHGVIALLESTYNSLDLDSILSLYADDAKLTAHCESPFLFWRTIDCARAFILLAGGTWSGVD